MDDPLNRDAKSVAPTVPLLHWVVLASWAVLFFGQMVWWAPNALLIFITAGPLLLPLRGMLHDRPRSYFWFNLLALMYFAGGVAGAYASDGENLIAWSQIVASVAGFVASFYRTKAIKEWFSAAGS